MANVNIPAPVANGSMEDAQNFVNNLPGTATPEQRQAIAQQNPGWHPDFIPDRPAATPDFIPDQAAAEKAPATFDDPRVKQLGYYVNGDGNTVIAPKDGEEYLDTIKRAIAHHQSLSPQEQEAAVDRETSNLGSKVIDTAGIAGGAGLTGAALLALTAETPAALKQVVEKAPAAYQAARTFIYNRLAAGTPELFGEEAAKATLKRLAVKAAVKLATGSAAGAGFALAHSVFEELFGGK